MTTKNQPPSRLTESGSALLTLVLGKSQTAEGFAFADALHITDNLTAIALRVSRLKLAGSLYRAKVPGHKVRYHATLELSQAWIAATPPNILEPKQREPKPKQIKPPKRTKGMALQEAIMAFAATPNGFSILNAPAEVKKSYVWVCCQKLAKSGSVIAVNADYKTKHYFTTQEAADLFEAEFKKRSKSRVIARIESQRKQPRAIYHQPKAPVKPRVDAEIVYTKNTRYIVIPTPAPRFQVISLPFQHGQMKEMTV